MTHFVSRLFLSSTESGFRNSVVESLRIATSISYECMKCAMPEVPVSGTSSSVAAATSASPAVGLVVSTRKQKRKHSRAQADARKVELQRHVSQEQHRTQNLKVLENLFEPNFGRR